jgi:hypothetical protein
MEVKMISWTIVHAVGILQNAMPGVNDITHSIMSLSFPPLQVKIPCGLVLAHVNRMSKT